jgi:hypothetical protein
MKVEGKNRDTVVFFMIEIGDSTNPDVRATILWRASVSR